MTFREDANFLCSSSQARVEKKLDKFLAEIRAGKREGSIVSIETIESLSSEDKDAWRQLRAELEDIGIGASLFLQHHAFIVYWFQLALRNGAFNEVAIEDTTTIERAAIEAPPKPIALLENVPQYPRELIRQETFEQSSRRKRNVLQRAMQGVSDRFSIGSRPEGQRLSTNASVVSDIAEGHRLLSKRSSANMAALSQRSDAPERIEPKGLSWNRSSSRLAAISQKMEPPEHVEEAERLSSRRSLARLRAKTSILALDKRPPLPMAKGHARSQSLGDGPGTLDQKPVSSPTGDRRSITKLLPLRTATTSDVSRSIFRPSARPTSEHSPFQPRPSSNNFPDSPRASIPYYHRGSWTPSHQEAYDRHEATIKNLYYQRSAAEEAQIGHARRSLKLGGRPAIDRIAPSFDRLASSGMEISIPSPSRESAPVLHEDDLEDVDNQDLENMTTSFHEDRHRPTSDLLPASYHDLHSSSRKTNLSRKQQQTARASSDNLLDQKLSKRRDTDFRTVENTRRSDQDKASRSPMPTLETPFYSSKHVEGLQASNSGSKDFKTLTEQENIEIVHRLMLNGRSVDFRDNHGSTPLHKACQYGQTQFLSFLIENGADVRLKNSVGQTPLDIAVGNMDSKTTHALLDSIPASSIREIWDSTVLHTALKRRDVIVASLLIRHGADVNRRDFNGLTALHIAASERPTGTLIVPLIQAGADVNASATVGGTPMHKAAASGYTKAIQLLLDNGGIINSLDLSGQTPLHRAAELGKLKTLRLLVENGADVSACTPAGMSPLHIAALCGHSAVVQFLIWKRATINALTTENLTPLDLAIRAGNKDTVMVLLGKGAKVVDCSKSLMDAIAGTVEVNVVNGSAHDESLQSPSNERISQSTGLDDNPSGTDLLCKKNIGVDQDSVSAIPAVPTPTSTMAEA